MNQPIMFVANATNGTAVKCKWDFGGNTTNNFYNGHFVADIVNYTFTR